MATSTPLLEEMIKIDSSSKEGVEEIVDYCEKWLMENGLSVKRLKNNGYSMLVCEIGNGEESVVFNAHVDVVEGEKEQFIPYEKDGKLHGRGAVDMKAGASAMMKTLAEVKEMDLPFRLMLQIVPDEESGGEYGTKYLTEQGYTGDFIICGEPTNLGIAVQSKGVLQLDFLIYGQAAHGSRPWEGENAITNAYSLYEQIFELPFAKEEEKPVYGAPSVNLAKIEGGNAYNQVPKKCTMSLDIRYLPKQSPDEIIRQIREITKGELYVHQVGDPIRTKMDNPYVNALATSLTEKTELEKANLYGQHGSNDGKFFTRYGGSAVEFGPLGHGWHGDREFVYIDSVHEYQRILINFVKTLAEKNK
ncbi:M20 family metallopeptidase [Alkalicoccus halolimnae]|uniref:M20/M25/M40 family metallo-hydrolase n=1 Tax=Alkalicoccus halolimnae TaxID=1667239 RepID=A0A5C7F1G9_9BACI|nr:M20/M25/M40 family metallo-hydrolase [Alkalicoccus halolimnae]TXF81971.1 M20/M25/M40 family metallo-hydrolase [Alkalicoccus halolimnae]